MAPNSGRRLGWQVVQYVAFPQRRWTSIKGMARLPGSKQGSINRWAPFKSFCSGSWHVPASVSYPNPQRRALVSKTPSSANYLTFRASRPRRMRSPFSNVADAAHGRTPRRGSTKTPSSMRTKVRMVADRVVVVGVARLVSFGVCTA